MSQDNRSVHNIPRRQLNRISHKSVHQRISHTQQKNAGLFAVRQWLNVYEIYFKIRNVLCICEHKYISVRLKVKLRACGVNLQLADISKDMDMLRLHAVRGN